MLVNTKAYLVYITLNKHLFKMYTSLQYMEINILIILNNKILFFPVSQLLFSSKLKEFLRLSCSLQSILPPQWVLVGFLSRRYSVFINDKRVIHIQLLLV